MSDTTEQTEAANGRSELHDLLCAKRFSIKNAVAVACFLAGNYAYQWLQVSPDYNIANERTFFQLVAIIYAAYIFARRA